MSAWVLLSWVAAVLAVGACGPLPKPDIVASTPASVIYEWTHHYWTVGQVTEMAQSYCQQYGKNALLVNGRQISLDRSVANFHCVSPAR